MEAKEKADVATTLVPVREIEYRELRRRDQRNIRSNIRSNIQSNIRYEPFLHQLRAQPLAFLLVRIAPHRVQDQLRAPSRLDLSCRAARPFTNQFELRVPCDAFADHHHVAVKPPTVELALAPDLFFSEHADGERRGLRWIRGQRRKSLDKTHLLATFGSAQRHRRSPSACSEALGKDPRSAAMVDEDDIYCNFDGQNKQRLRLVLQLQPRALGLTRNVYRMFTLYLASSAPVHRQR